MRWLFYLACLFRLNAPNMAQILAEQDCAVSVRGYMFSNNCGEDGTTCSRARKTHKQCPGYGISRDFVDQTKGGTYNCKAFQYNSTSGNVKGPMTKGVLKFEYWDRCRDCCSRADFNCEVEVNKCYVF